MKPALLKGLCSVSTVSTKSVSAICTDLIRILKQVFTWKFGIVFVVLQVSLRQTFTIRIYMNINHHGRALSFDIFIVKVLFLSFNGIQFRRLVGDKLNCMKMNDQIQRDLRFSYY